MATKKLTQMNSLYKTSDRTNSSLMYTEIVEFNGRRFRILIELRNGATRSYTMLEILTSDGVFKQIANAYILNIPIISYVCCHDEYKVNETIKTVREEFTKYLNALYI